jgi:hypothetical protein
VNVVNQEIKEDWTETKTDYRIDPADDQVTAFSSLKKYPEPFCDPS